MGKTESLWGNGQLKGIWIVRNKDKPTLLPALSFSPGFNIFIPNSSTCAPEAVLGSGELWSVGNSSSLPPSPLLLPHAFPLPWRGSFPGPSLVPLWSPAGDPCCGACAQASNTLLWVMLERLGKQWPSSGKVLTRRKVLMCS